MNILNKRFISNFVRFNISLAAFMFFLLSTACGYEDGLVNHALEFDLRYDGQDATVTDYKYMADDRPIASSPDPKLYGNVDLYSDGINGPMPRGTSLYVKWRNIKTGKIYEDTVDLRHRLPSDIRDKTIYFMIWGAQLHIYLIPSSIASPDKLEMSNPNDSIVGPSMYRHLKTIQIYPDQQKR